MSIRTHTWTTKSGETRTAYVVQYSTAELDKRGKRKRHLKFFKLKKDAAAFHAQVHVDLSKGVHMPASRSITVAQAGDDWLASCADLERTTRNGYAQHLSTHILPDLGAVKLSALTVAIVRTWQDKLRKAGRTAVMVRKVTTSLSSLLADAQERGHVGTNVARSLKANGKTERRAKGRLKVGTDIPTPAEIDAILAVAKGRWRPFLLVAIRCGLRSSELRGIRWQDIDFGKAELHVHQRADAFNEIGRPKSAAGERTVPIPPTTLLALKDWKPHCPAAGLVFPNDQGEIETHRNIIRLGLVPTWEQAGVTGRYGGTHSLRHYFVSWCLARPPIGLGLNLKEASTRAGHANIAITADTYGHLLPRDDSAELAAAEGKFG
jgi:integrase